MTRNHRRGHFIIWLILTPAILGVLAGAIAVRIHAAALRSGAGR
jgi:hypothetical protein